MAEQKKKLPSTFFNMVIVLTVIALISAFALGLTYSGTKDAIAMVEVNRVKKALNEVLPRFDNDPTAEKYTLEDEDYAEMELFPAKDKDGKLIGTAVRTYSDNGFTERIWLIVGFTADRKISNISVVKHKETPGLGTKMKEPKFKDQFKGMDPAATKFKVTKDGGEIDAISAATITSRAFCEATEKAYHALKDGKKIEDKKTEEQKAEVETETTEKPETPGKPENLEAEKPEVKKEESGETPEGGEK